jgi:uncharacterized protein (TIGR03118 family)
MQRRQLLITLPAAALLGACGDGNDDEPNRYLQEDLVRNSASTGPIGTERSSEFLNAWGIAIRPAGAGGHFWVTAGGYSFQFIGDVRGSSTPALRRLAQDALTLVRIPGAGAPEGETQLDNVERFAGFATGTVFNGAAIDSERFVVSGQPVNLGGTSTVLEGSARFIFATDSGVISGWTEREAASGATVRSNGPAVATFDGSALGHAYFGIALRPGSWDRLWAADFGAAPQIRSFNAQWQLVDEPGAFANPFIGTRSQAVPGDYVPFNIQVLEFRGSAYAFVAYAKSQPDPADPTRFLAAEEDALSAADEGPRPDRGRVAMFDLQGRLLRRVADDGRLNAPWGLAVAPANFGPFSHALLVGNFGGSGRIAAYEIDSGRFLGYLKQPDGRAIAIEGLWGLQFGNGQSLGDSAALYFAAGPGDETQGLFGSLRHAP